MTSRGRRVAAYLMLVATGAALPTGARGAEVPGQSGTAAAEAPPADPLADVRLPEQCLRVPEQHATIQAAIDAAPNGATVLVAPGVYHESLRLAGKSVHLASWFLVRHDPRDVDRTVLDGTLPDPDIEDDVTPMVEQVILVEESAGPETTILGFTIRDGDDGIACHAQVRILHNRIVNNVDGIDFENGGGLCQFNRFVANDDDAVDYDEGSSGICGNNEMRDNDDDGIEIRLHPYRGKRLDLAIHDNQITGNGENGIQVIDYPELSDRSITIERNVIANNAMAGIGCMSDAVTREDYRGAPIPEQLTIVNNTLAGNHYGITGGANARVANNVVAYHQHAALKNIAGDSVLTANLVWANGQAAVGCNLSADSVIEADPRLDAHFRPQAESPCIDGGTTLIDLSEARPTLPTSFAGRAPDLGAAERR